LDIWERRINNAGLSNQGHKFFEIYHKRPSLLLENIEFFFLRRAQKAKTPKRIFNSIFNIKIKMELEIFC